MSYSFYGVNNSDFMYWCSPKINFDCLWLPLNRDAVLFILWIPIKQHKWRYFWWLAKVVMTYYLLHNEEIRIVSHKCFEPNDTCQKFYVYNTMWAFYQKSNMFWIGIVTGVSIIASCLLLIFRNKKHCSHWFNVVWLQTELKAFYYCHHFWENNEARCFSIVITNRPKSEYLSSLYFPNILGKFVV